MSASPWSVRRKGRRNAPSRGCACGRGAGEAGRASQIVWRIHAMPLGRLGFPHGISLRHLPRAWDWRRDRDAGRDHGHARLRPRTNDLARRHHRPNRRRPARRHRGSRALDQRDLLSDRRRCRLRRGQRCRRRRRPSRGQRLGGARLPRLGGGVDRPRARDPLLALGLACPGGADLARHLAPPPRPAQARRPARPALAARSRIIGSRMAAKKLILTYVDSLRTDMLERTVAEGRASTFAALLARGVLGPDCVSSSRSVTPVACAELATATGAERHWISGMNWYHRLERRYVEYGSSLEATRAFGIFRALYDLVYNMNLAHLSPEVETLFERLDDADLRTACTPFLIFRGRHRHRVSLDGLLRRAVDATRLKFQHHTWGPRELFYGALYPSREVPCRPTSIPGSRDGYSACCAAELLADDGFDFLLLSLPDNDNYSHRHGPEASVESIARADECFAKLVEAAGGLDPFLLYPALILLSH